MLIGVTGTDGSGKGMVVEYLLKHKGFVHYSARELITTEIGKRGLSKSRENTRIVANDMRRQHGNDVIVATALKKIKEQGVTDAVVESIRALAEAKTLKENGGILLAVDANQTLRYQRVVARGSETDHITFEEFKAQEMLEMNDPDPHGMQKAKVMELADATILNEGSLEELHRDIEQFLQKYGI